MRLVLCLGAALAAAVSVSVSGPDGARLVAQNLTRSQIRSMPIMERPNRPIHFYGNAVRRRNARAATPAPIPGR